MLALAEYWGGSAAPDQQAQNRGNGEPAPSPLDDFDYILYFKPKAVVFDFVFFEVRIFFGGLHSDTLVQLNSLRSNATAPR